MSIELSSDDFVLQFLVQEVLQDLGRYYERCHQRSLYVESLEGVQSDIKNHVINEYVTDTNSADQELENIIDAVQDQLNHSKTEDTVKIKAYLDVFDEWCLERLDTESDVILEEGTEGKPEARKWLDMVQQNVSSVPDDQIDDELKRNFQNRLTERWNEIYDRLSEKNKS